MMNEYKKTPSVCPVINRMHYFRNDTFLKDMIHQLYPPFSIEELQFLNVYFQIESNFEDSTIEHLLYGLQNTLRDETNSNCPFVIFLIYKLLTITEKYSSIDLNIFLDLCLPFIYADNHNDTKIFIFLIISQFNGCHEISTVLCSIIMQCDIFRIENLNSDTKNEIIAGLYCSMKFFDKDQVQTLFYSIISTRFIPFCENNQYYFQIIYYLFLTFRKDTKTMAHKFNSMIPQFITELSNSSLHYFLKIIQLIYPIFDENLILYLFPKIANENNAKHVTKYILFSMDFVDTVNIFTDQNLLDLLSIFQNASFKIKQLLIQLIIEIYTKMININFILPIMFIEECRDYLENNKDDPEDDTCYYISILLQKISQDDALSEGINI